MRLVTIESPYGARDVEDPEEHRTTIELNGRYARAALRDAIDHGEAPLASHLLYTQVLDDNVPEERARGIACGLAWARFAAAMVFYVDLGWSSGMVGAWNYAKTHNIRTETRVIEGWQQQSQTTSLRTSGTSAGSTGASGDSRSARPTPDLDSPRPT